MRKGRMFFRVFTVELKRMLKTRSVLALILAAVVLAPVLAYFPASFESWVYRDSQGNEVRVSGQEAIRMERENQGQFQGEITEGVLSAALQRYRDFESGYEGGLPDGIYDERVTASDYYEKVANVDGLLSRVNEAWADPETGIAPGLHALTQEQTADFYGQCRRHLKDLLYLEGGKNARTESAVRQAEALYSQVEMPFTYEPGFTNNAMEYIGIYVFLLVLICTFLLVPAFASDYQTQADQILKCAREGKKSLAASRILAGVLIAAAVYLLCMTLFLVLLNTSFGWKGLDTSMQLFVSVAVFLPLNVGQMELLIALAGFVSLLATSCFTLFLSGRAKSVASASIISFAFLILPMIVYMVLSGNLGNWIRCLLPSGGVGLMNSFTYAALDTSFAYIGGRAVWLPYLMMASASAAIVLFAILAGISWCRKEK